MKPELQRDVALAPMALAPHLIIKNVNNNTFSLSPLNHLSI
jgi:hypothetical protein